MFDNIKSIAIIGSSNSTGKVGYLLTKNLVDFGFNGKIFPINTKENKILGINTFSSIDDISEDIDLAVIVIPAKFVNDEVRKVVKKKIKYLVVISAGFKETGEEGGVLENELIDIIKNSSTKLIGPNCLGFIDTRNKINVSFAKNFPTVDSLSFISQSGAMGTAFLDWAEKENIGVDLFISVGNKADIDEEYLLKRINSKLISFYLEDIKFGKKFLETGRNVNRKTPCIVIKPGESTKAQGAISSHTGSIAGDYKLIKSSLEKNGFTLARTIGEFFNLAKTFLFSPLPKNGGVAIVTNAGGPAVITTDLVMSTNSLYLANISKDTEDILKKHLPRESNFHNPIDVIGDALSDRYYYALDAVLNEDEVGSVIVILTPQIMTDIDNCAKTIASMKKYNKPILVSFIGGTAVENGLTILHKNKVPAFNFPEDAVNSLNKLYKYSMFVDNEVSKSELKSNVDGYTNENRLTIKKEDSYIDTYELLKSYNIPLINQEWIENIEHLKNFFDNSEKKSVSIKVISKTYTHKSDLGLVINNVDNEEKLIESFNKLEGLISHYNIKDAKILAQEYISGGLDLFIGGTNDTNFGSFVLFGTGGIFAETINDINILSSPNENEDIKRMIEETKMGKIILHNNRSKKYNTDGVIELIKSLNSLLIENPWIKNIDLNPVILTEDGGIYIVDARIDKV